MKLIDTQCPHCGANMHYEEGKKQINCEFCGAALIVDDETHNLHMSNGEEFGYQFEKGRQRAQSENNNNISQVPSSQNNQMPPKKRKTWLWVLGWIFIFPVPLTIILLKKPDMEKNVKYVLIAAAWIVYVLLMVVAMLNNSNDKNNTNDIKAVKTTVATAATEATTIEATTIPTTTVPITAKPTEAPKTVKPTDPPTQIVFTNYTNYVEAGGIATVTIQGKPSTMYDIDVIYSSGSSSAEGLESKQSDENGIVTWEWKVGIKTEPGIHTIKVSGGEAVESVSFEVI